MGWLAKPESPTPQKDEPCAVARHGEHVQGRGGSERGSSLAGRTKSSNNLNTINIKDRACHSVISVGILMAQGAAGIGGRAEVEVVYPHVGCELEAALGRQALVVPAEDTVAQASANWLSGGLFQRQSMP